jgi:hypothetical protein
MVGLLRLAADDAFSLGANRVVCDYASAPGEGEPGTVLLVGALRDRMTGLTQALEAARFRPKAVTSTVAALAAAGSQGDGRLTAMTAHEALEVARVDRTGLTGLRHLSASGEGASPAAMARALRLAAGSMAGADGARFALWDDGSDQALRDACAEVGVELAPPPSLPLSGVSEAATGERLTGAQVAAGAALAIGALAPRRLPFDLVHSRLAPREAHRWRRPAVWAACVVLVLALAGVLLMADRRVRRREIAELRSRLQEMGPSIEAAESVVQSVTEARAWYDRRPPFLDCLLALTLAFPEDSRIWTTSLAVDDDMHGALTGKATAEEPVLVVLDALTASGDFSDVKLLYLQETRGAAGERTFSITFAYTGAE